MTLRALLFVLPVLVLAACAAPTPYAPAPVQGYGYDTRKLEEGRFRLTFSGNSVTSLRTVETYLLYRAAEVTLEQGGDWFRVVRRDVEPHTRWYSSYDGPPWHPWGWDPWYPGYPYSAWHDHTTRSVTRYTAHAEITVHRGRKPDDPGAYDARSVIRNLASEVRTPGAPPG